MPFLMRCKILFYASDRIFCKLRKLFLSPLLLVVSKQKTGIHARNLDSKEDEVTE